MAFFLWSAAVVAATTFAVHTIVGGKIVARPLLMNTDLPKASKWLHYYTWHITSVMIAFVAAAFAGLAMTTEQTDAANQTSAIVFLSSLMASISLLSIFVAIKGGIHPLRFPSTSLFAVTSALGWSALFT